MIQKKVVIVLNEIYAIAALGWLVNFSRVGCVTLSLTHPTRWRSRSH
ncbi:hypothetical protein [Coleofasciculus sp.]